MVLPGTPTAPVQGNLTELIEGAYRGLLEDKEAYTGVVLEWA